MRLFGFALAAILSTAGCRSAAPIEPRPIAGFEPISVEVYEAVRKTDRFFVLRGRVWDTGRSVPLTGIQVTATGRRGDPESVDGRGEFEVWTSGNQPIRFETAEGSILLERTWSEFAEDVERQR